MKSSVFPAPARIALSASSYDAACTESERACGKKVSQQMYGILPRIRDVDALLRESPSLVDCVREVHPEVCFWNDHRHLGHSKKSGFGFMERFAMVETVFGSSPRQVRATVPRKQATDDDILAAFAALWTAQRIHGGTATGLNENDERDAFDLSCNLGVVDAG